MQPGNRLEYLLILGIAFLFRWLPINLSRGLGRSVGSFAGNVLKIRRQVAEENLSRAFPELSPLEIHQRYLQTWQHFGMVASELARLPRMELENLREQIDYPEPETLKAIFQRGKGVIFVSGHLGNWEWLGAMVASSGFPFTFVVEQQSNRLVEAWIDRMRMRGNVEIFSRSHAAKGTLQALKNNRMVAMLSDQDAGSAGVFVRFFKRPASTPRGPALFHLKTGAPLVYGSCCRESGRYRLHFEEIVPVPLSGDREIDERAIMELISSRLEADIRAHPDQYMWLHRRWKTPIKQPNE